MYKQVCSLSFILVLLLTLVACGGNNETPATTAPAAPEAIVAAVTSEGITITWEAKSDNEDNFIIYRAEAIPQNISGQALSPNDLIEYAKADQGVTSYTDTAVNPDKEYLYAISSRNSKGESPDPSDLVNLKVTTSTVVQPKPPAGDFRLRVLRNGDGGGAVTSTPAGITCDQQTGGDCNEIFTEGTVVTLTANPDASSKFESWGGACSGTAPSCQITIGSDLADTDGDIGVTVNIRRTGVAIKVEKTGTGTGTVTSSPENINCGTTCTGTWSVTPITVVLKAEPAESSLFTKWTGCPQIEGTKGNFCRITQNEPGSVTVGAEFMLPPPVINSFTVTPEKSRAGEPVTLAWNVTGEGTISLELFQSNTDPDDAPAIDISGKGPIDSIVLNPSLSTTYTLRAITESGSTETGEGDKGDKDVTVSIGDKPEITSFTAEDTTVLAGSAVELSWTVTGTGDVALVLNDGTTDTPVTGTKITIPAVTKDVTYTLKASSAFGEDTSSPLLIDVGVAPVFSVKPKADDDTVVSGTDVTLSWTVTGATKVELSGGELTSPRDVTLPASSKQVKPVSATSPATRTYTVTASNDFGEVAELIAIKIGEAAKITPASFKAAETAINAGEDVDLSWAITGTEPTVVIERTEALAPTVITSIPILEGATTYKDEALIAGVYSYKLVVTNDYGLPASLSLTTPVTVTGEPASITLFEVAEAVLVAGDDAEFEWTVEGTDPVITLTRSSAAGDVVLPILAGATSYTDEDVVAGSYTYTLAATNIYGPPASEVLIVTVGAAP